MSRDGRVRSRRLAVVAARHHGVAHLACGLGGAPPHLLAGGFHGAVVSARVEPIEHALLAFHGTAIEKISRRAALLRPMDEGWVLALRAPPVRAETLPIDTVF